MSPWEAAPGFTMGEKRLNVLDSVFLVLPWRLVAFRFCIYEFLTKRLYGVGWADPVHIRVWFSLAYVPQLFFPFLNLKVTLKASNVEMTLSWKDLFRARALFLWIFCLANHGECVCVVGSVKEVLIHFRGQGPFYGSKAAPFSLSLWSTWALGRKAEKSLLPRALPPDTDMFWLWGGMELKIRTLISIP
jgi:hypothetical protein